MVLYDANDILTLVKNQWSLFTFSATSTNPRGTFTFNENLNIYTGFPAGEQAVNGGFETGDTTGWTGTDLSDVTSITGYVHSGTYACNIGQHGNPCSPTYGQLIQTWVTPIPVSSIQSMSVWVRAIDGLQGSAGYIIITYSDLTTVTINPTTQFQQWLQVNILPSLNQAKSVKSITMGKTGPYGFDYVDDFDLTTASNGMRLQLDEYDSMHPEYQIVFLNRPERVTPVAPNVIKHEQVVGVEFFMKLVNYQPDDIEAVWRPLILAVKNELTRIMNTYRFNGLGNGTTINHSDWKDSKFPHGFGQDADPINLSSTMTLEIVWYEALSADEIGMRVTALDIFNVPLLGLLDLTFVDTDPWVKLQVPKGPLLEQHLLGPHMEGRFTCHDWHSLWSLLYNTAIPENLSYKAINTDNSKTVFGTNPANPEFVIYIQDQNSNTNGFQFINVRIQSVELSRATVLGTEPLNWTVKWMADYIYPIPPIT